MAQIKVGLVGFSGTPFDVLVLTNALDELRIGMYDRLDSEAIDLQLGKDFLKMTERYDVVILNYIFLPGDNPSEMELKIMGIDPSFRVSELQSPLRWRERLVETGAKIIYIFGGGLGSEVDGDYIGILPGYEKEVKHDGGGSIWKYRKRELSGAHVSEKEKVQK